MKTTTTTTANFIADTPARNTRNTHTLWQRSLVAIALLVTCMLGVKAEQYVIYYQGGDGTKYYMANVDGTLTSTTTYDAATCVWVGTSGNTFSNNGQKISFESASNYAREIGLSPEDRKSTRLNSSHAT